MAAADYNDAVRDAGAQLLALSDRMKAAQGAREKLMALAKSRTDAAPSSTVQQEAARTGRSAALNQGQVDEIRRLKGKLAPNAKTVVQLCVTLTDAYKLSPTADGGWIVPWEYALQRWADSGYWFLIKRTQAVDLVGYSEVLAEVARRVGVEFPGATPADELPADEVVTAEVAKRASAATGAVRGWVVKTLEGAIEIMSMASPDEVEASGQVETLKRQVQQVQHEADRLGQAQAKAVEEEKRREEQVRREAEKEAKRVAAEKVKQEAAERRRRAAEEAARKEAEEKARRQEEERLKREAEDQRRREAEERRRREAEEKARELEERRRRAVEEAARREAEEKARAEAKARREVEERARREAEERARQEEERRRREEEEQKVAEERAQRDEVERRRRAAEEMGQKLNDAEDRRRAEAEARREAEERARKEEVERVRREKQACTARLTSLGCSLP